jgi:hypothetical protein
VLVSSFVLLITQVNATVIPYTGALAVTCNGPTGVLVSLGFENIPGLSTAQWIWMYNVVSILGISIVGALSSERTTRFFVILIPLVAMLFIFFGWLNITDANGNYIQNEQIALWSNIIGCLLLGVMVYMKETLREKWGIGGPGSTLMNIAYFIVILQAVIGLVNNPTIGLYNNVFGPGTGNVANTPTEWQNSTVAVSQMSEVGNSGGALTSLISDGSLLLTISIGALVGLVNVILGVVLISAVLAASFPFLLASPFAVAFLIVIQIADWLLLIKVAYDVFYTKTPFLDV